MNRLQRMVITFCCVSTLFSAVSQAAGYKPNVMILLDSSGSMGNTVQALADYVRTTSYSNCAPGNYATAKVYQYDAGSYVEYAASIVAVSSAPVEAALTTRGFWFGTLGASSLKLFHGNYLNYEFCSTLTSRTKLAIAKSVINTVIGAIPEKRFGAMKFNSTNNGGTVVSPIGTSTAAIATAVNAITASGTTPLGPQLRDAGYYFDGGFGGHATPIQDRCQQNSVFIISDGAENVGPPWVIPQATSEYTRDHSTTFAGIQNLIVNTVSFYLNPVTDRVAISSLTAAAYYGGGTYISANDPAQLSQAFFQISPGIVLTAPLPNSIVSGNVLLSVGVGNAACITSVQFKVDGVDKGAPITGAPYSYLWNSNTVQNGTHTVTAVMLDADGNTDVSFPALITTSNDQTPPVINSVNWTTWYTSATVTWQTNEPGDTQVWYGTTTAYNMQTALAPTLVTDHSQLITGLTPGILYHSSVTSRDAAGNLTTLGDIPFTTLGTIQLGELQHFKLTFGNAALPGPGVKTGNYPYALTAGDCYGLTIEAVDNLNRHNNLTDDIAIGLYDLDDSELEVSLVPGISLRDNFQLGLSTMVLHMVNGYVFLGSETDINKQICFYRATQAPGSYKQSGAPGDLHLKVVQISSPSINGISSSFIVWPGYANGISLLAPNVTLVPATPAGVTGSVVTQNQGTPFLVRAYLVDRYFNNARTNADTLRFTSSLSGQTGFVPFEGRVADGVLSSSVTVDACSTSLTLSVQDLTSPSLANAQTTIPLAACGSAPPGPGFYQIAIPGLARAGDPFGVTITIKNVTRPIGAGSLKYVGNLVPLVPLDLTHFTYAGGTLSLPTFEFDIPDGWNGGVMGDYVHTLSNQTYNHSEIIWIQLVGTGPAELKDATALGGPMQVLPATPHRLTASASPSTIGPLSSTVITAKLSDIYGNGVPNVTVSALVTQGTGNFNVADIPTTSLTMQTDAKGEITIPFISHRVSETDKVSMWVPSYPGISTVLTISITLIGDKTVAVYPNPARITERPAVIEYRLDDDSTVELLICDAFGHEVWKRNFPAGAPGGLAGYNTVEWDGRNGAGQRVAVGIYRLHLRMTANSYTKEAKTRFGIAK